MSFQVYRQGWTYGGGSGGRGTEEEEEEEGTTEMVVAQKKQTTLPIENTNIYTQLFGTYDSSGILFLKKENYGKENVTL